MGERVGARGARLLQIAQEPQRPVLAWVGRQPVRSREDAEFFARWIDRLDEAARADEAWNTPDERDQVLRLLTQARAVYAQQAGTAIP